MCYKQTILYNPYIPDSLQFAEVKPGKFGMAWKSSTVQYFILPQCGAVQGYGNGHGSCRDLVTLGKLYLPERTEMPERTRNTETNN